MLCQDKMQHVIGMLIQVYNRQVSGPLVGMLPCLSLDVLKAGPEHVASQQLSHAERIAA